MAVLPKLLLAALLPLAALAAGGRETGKTGPEGGAPSLAALKEAARPIGGAEADYSDILAAAAGASRILLGESTHGTHEYYRERGRLTERLIREQGANAVAIEGDWSATQRVNLYVRGLGRDRSADEALRGYTHFPQWMWLNREFREFVERLRALNLERPAEQRVGLYGMDVYDLFDAAEAVEAYLAQDAPEAARRAARGKLVLWSHNTHSGDARATFAADRGELNLGQLMRQRHGQAAFLIGFFSHSGTVLAAPEWDARGRRYAMRPALAGSYSALFHSLALPAFSLRVRGDPAVARLLAGPMLERAIGVVYLPHSERTAHYFEARLAEQFDAVVYFDRSAAVDPLAR